MFKYKLDRQFFDIANEVFICDLFAFHRATLLRASEVPLQEKNDKLFRLLYDKGQYTIVWRENNSSNFTRVSIFSDNFEYLYAKTMLKYSR